MAKLVEGRNLRASQAAKGAGRKMRVELRTPEGPNGDAYFDGEKWREPQHELDHLFRCFVTFTFTFSAVLRRSMPKEVVGHVHVFAELDSDPSFDRLEAAAKWAADNSTLQDLQMDTAFAYQRWSEWRLACVEAAT